MTTRIKFQFLILSLVIVGLSIRPGSAQSQQSMTFDDIMNLRVVSDPHISPDGKRVAFVVTQADMKSNFRNSDVWLVSSDAGEPRPICAARGYASFFPNFRGSSNYGPEFASANVNDLGGGDYNDIMSGIDYLIERGIADPSRLAIKGYSYGGYMSGWIIGHTDRFKAAVFGAGLSNAISYYSQADIQFGRETLHQGNPWRNNQNMIERSPVFYLQNAKTPSLIYQGEKDERVPLPQSLETYMGLKKAGVTTQLVIYPREGHGLREPKHQLDKMRREAEWIEKFVGVDRSSAAR